MKTVSQLLCGILLAGVCGAIGCTGQSENEVIVDPNAGTEAQQKELEEYDKQQAAQDANYQ